MDDERRLAQAREILAELPPLNRNVIHFFLKVRKALTTCSRAPCLFNINNNNNRSLFLLAP